MTDLRYSLIRYIPDMDRMEPINVGVILQEHGGRIDFKLSPHAAKRTEVETEVFQKWRAFLQDEIRGDAVPLLQPPKGSVAFLDHLARLCEHTVLISPPLAVSVQADEPFGDVLESLYQRLVVPFKPVKKHPERPTSQFREFEKEKHFRKRGLKKHPYLALGGDRPWNAFRHAQNGEDIVIDKVEVGIEVGLTAGEIQKLSSGVESFLNAFLQGRTPEPRYYLIADELSEKFTDQEDADFQTMQEEFDRVLGIVGRRGGTIFRKKNEVLEFAQDLDRKLPALSEAITD